MAETTIDLRNLPLAEAYGELHSQVRAVLDGVDDPIAAMSTIAALIHNGFGHLWTGFYRVAVPEIDLRVGPYLCTLGFIDIAFGRGVCGTAASEKRTVIVEDVNAFPDHITCDARSQSEIVVPVFDSTGTLIAVLDIDSDQPATFGDADREGLERVMTWFRENV
jgi:GAF domain-containing protein